MSRKQLKAAMDLVRRLPPAKQTKTLAAILTLIPDDDFAEELLADVDQPLKQRACEQTGHPFIICEYNRDADSFRSPWSSEYCPALEGGVQPPPALRDLEVRLNAAFQAFCSQYYGSDGVSSCYCWDAGEEGSWACAVLFRKEVKGVGTWNSMHVLNVQDYTAEKVACYQMTSSVMLNVTEKEGKARTFRLAGNVAKQWKQFDAHLPDDSAHITNIGSYVQKYENKLRGNLSDIYFGKSQQVVSEVRSLRPEMEQRHMLTMQAKPKRKRVWKQYADEEGQLYWYNTVTGDSQWEEPADVDAVITKERKEKKEKGAKSGDGGLMGELAAAQASRAAGQEAAESQVTERAEKKEKKEKKKKSVWKALQDEEGATYWYNSKTGETSWEPPPEEGAAVVEDPPAEEKIRATPRSNSPQQAGEKPSESSTVDDICAWLGTLALSADYSSSVRSNAIDGAVLATLTSADLPEAMGIKAFGDKRKVSVAMGW
eukprot:Hpha_TRINITY_DN15793_c1_g6::TRINITY_DN15793_c1_g6_i1::g.38943::m.38943/K10365/CAPZB; capping protein (actin filament) muscle Z-line, beta